MKSHVAIYKTRDEAMKAIQALSDRNFEMDHVSLIGKADIIDNNIHSKSIEDIKLLPLFVSIVLGAIFGMMLGLKVIIIPSLSFSMDSGFFVSIFFGAAMGLIVGALSVIAVTAIFPKDKVLKYEEHMFTKRFLVIVNGSEEEIERAEHILHTEGMFKAVS